MENKDKERHAELNRYYYHTKKEVREAKSLNAKMKRDSIRKTYRKWQQNNPDKISGYNQYRDMNKKHEISKEEWENCKNYFNYRCAYCNLPVEEHLKMWNGKLKQIDLHKEHVDHDGANDLSNCIPACQSCNSSKHTSTLTDWYNEENKVFTQERLDKIIKWLNNGYLQYKE